MIGLSEGPSLPRFLMSVPFACVHTRVCACTSAWVRVCMHTCVHTSAYMHMCVCAYTCVCVHVLVCARVCFEAPSCGERRAASPRFLSCAQAPSRPSPAGPRGGPLSRCCHRREGASGIESCRTVGLVSALLVSA